MAQARDAAIMPVPEHERRAPSCNHVDAFLTADETLDREALNDMGVKRGHQAPLLHAIAAESKTRFPKKRKPPRTRTASSSCSDSQASM